MTANGGAHRDWARPTEIDDETIVRERAQLELTWREPPGGFVGWLSRIDHKSSGRRFIVTAFVWFTLGGILAALMRLQLSRPDNHLLSADLYNQIFTMHGVTMMFLFAVPIMLGIAVYFVPLMIGARSIAFPRLVAFGYWMFLFAGMFLYGMFLLNIGPDNGWFSYVPLAGPEYGAGKRADVGAAHHVHRNLGPRGGGGHHHHWWWRSWWSSRCPRWSWRARR
jgi:cytochrome c oxidase subunit 1